MKSRSSRLLAWTAALALAVAPAHADDENSDWVSTSRAGYSLAPDTVIQMKELPALESTIPVPVFLFADATIAIDMEFGVSRNGEGVRAQADYEVAAEYFDSATNQLLSVQIAAGRFKTGRDGLDAAEQLRLRLARHVPLTATEVFIMFRVKPRGRNPAAGADIFIAPIAYASFKAAKL